MKIEAGKYYLTRDGRRVGPMLVWSAESSHRWSDHMTDGTHVWRDDGSIYSTASLNDLVAEWVGPVDEQAKAAVEAIASDDYFHSHLADGTPVPPVPPDVTVETSEDATSFGRSDMADTIAFTQSYEDRRLDAIAAAMQPVRVQLLHEGATLTNGDRDVEYGRPSVNMAAAGALKEAFRAHLNRVIEPAELEAIDLALTKIGRMATGKKPKRDTYVDGATYLAIAGEIALEADAKAGA